MEKDYDVAIIGAGPVGGNLANELAKKGYNVAVFEEHREIGYPLQCAGLVTPRIFKLLNIKKQNIIQNKIHGARIHSPQDIKFIIGGNKLHAYVINRPLFDKAILQQASDNGASIYLQSRVSYAYKKREKVFLKIKNKISVSCKLLIGADGVHSSTRVWFNFPQPREILYGIGAELRLREKTDVEFVDIFIGENIAPGFFGWLIPINEEKCRVGLCIGKESKKHSLKTCFNKFLHELQKQKIIENREVKPNIGGAIPLGLLKKTSSSNVMIVGDAAAQVKPLSGGGLYPGIKCSKHCISTTLYALEENDFSEASLQKYHKSWIGDIGKEIKKTLFIRKIFKKLSDRDMDKIAMLLKENRDLIDIISKYGDMDYPSKLIKPLLSNPKFLMHAVPFAVKNIF
jgi:geranylgeranyl reductase family protein